MAQTFSKYNQNFSQWSSPVFITIYDDLLFESFLTLFMRLKYSVFAALKETEVLLSFGRLNMRSAHVSHMCVGHMCVEFLYKFWGDLPATGIIYYYYSVEKDRVFFSTKSFCWHYTISSGNDLFLFLYYIYEHLDFLKIFFANTAASMISQDVIIWSSDFFATSCLVSDNVYPAIFPTFSHL